MLTRSDLTRYGDILGFNLGQAQADYAQHLFLYFLYRRIKDELLFKGGTCLQKTFGLDRFSEDLDFTVNETIDLTAIAGDITSFGYPAEISKEKEDEFGISYVLKAKGALYDGREKSLAYVRAEMSKREKAILGYEVKTITPIYHDLPPYTIAAMHLEEILAEKVRAIMTREKARDVYDLWFMMKKGVSMNTGLIKRKLEFYGAEFHRDYFLESIHEREKIWLKELGPLIPRVPGFATIEREIDEGFARLETAD